MSRGLEGTTLADVVEMADVAKGTVLLYATDEEDLLALALHARVEAMAQARRTSLSAAPLLRRPRARVEAMAEARRTSLPAAPPVDRLIDGFEGCFDLYETCPALACRLLSIRPVATGTNGRAFTAYTLDFIGSLVDFVKEAKGRGELRATVAEPTVATTALAAYRFAVQAWRGGARSPRKPVDQLLRPSLALLRDGMLP